MKGETRATWAKRVAQLERSGLSAAAFAREMGLNPSTLKWWRAQLRRAAKPTALSFVELPPNVASTRGAFEVVFRSGARLRVPADFDDAMFTRLCALLEARP